MSEKFLQHVLVVAFTQGVVGDSEHLEVLLVKRKFPPYAAGLALPGGFVKPGETAMQAALREVHGETNLQLVPEDMIELSTRKGPSRDPRGQVESKVFLALIKKATDHSLRPGTSVESCGWVKVLSIPELAFDHGAILCEALSFGWPVIPPMVKRGESSTSWNPLFRLPKILSPKDVFENNLGQEVIFFGGSFHPWHQGHKACLELCPNPHIVVVPDANPWKLRTVAPTEQKRCFFKSLLALARVLSNLPYAVYPGFWGAEVENPTVDWVLPLKNINCSLLVGEDSYYSLPKWKRANDLIKGLQALYVAPRDCSLKDENLGKTLLTQNPNLKIVRLSDHPFKHLSSSEIRLAPKN